VGVDGSSPLPLGAESASTQGATASAKGADAEVVILAGGTGGAKLARGMLDAVGPERLAVIANTGDDIEIYGAHVSPDPDLVSFWLADLIDERGWGLERDTFAVMDALRDLGAEVWFNLGDRDLAWCLERRRLLQEGLTPTAALARLNDAIDLDAQVLPMCDQQVHTWVHSTGGWRSFQEFMIRERARGMIEGLEFRGAEQARPSEQALARIAGARAIVIGPSNPLASIAPILAVPGMREALAAAAAPVVAVSPIVGGKVLKGPTASFMAFAALECNATGVRDFYGDLLDGIVSDEPAPEDGPKALRIDTRMADPPARAELAERVLQFADSLAG
jgi:LPPG:FO 2-phospho-L-lactate transferase